MSAIQPTPVMNVSAALIETVASRSERVETEYDAHGSIPAVTLAQYLARWAQYTQTGDVEVLCAIIFIDRVCTRTGLVLTRRNMHRVILVALLAATKWREEHPFKMTHYAKVGGVPLWELSELETRFIIDLDWCVCVEESAMKQYEAKFRCHPAWDGEEQQEEDEEEEEEQDIMTRNHIPSPRAPAVLRG